MKKILNTFIPGSVFLILIMAVACNNSVVIYPEPVLPSVDMLSLNFADFTTFPDTTGGLKSDGYHTNYLVAFENIDEWNLSTESLMEIPVAIYTECLENTPQSIGDNTWEWSFSADILTVPYEIRMVVKWIDADYYSLKMYVSETGVYEDFMWIEGIIYSDFTYAEWVLYEDPFNIVPWLLVRANNNILEQTFSIIHTNVKVGGAENGSYLAYGTLNQEEYDASFRVSGTFGIIDVEWNTDTKAGRVWSDIFFEDEDWHCWNASYMNVDCN